MTLGPTIIRKCKECGELFSQDTIGSGNTFGATQWTDGKLDAPMLPDQPALVKCPTCSAVVWIEEQEVVGEISKWGSRGETNPAFENAQSYDTPTFDDYIEFLNLGSCNKEQQRYVRLRAWWHSNDFQRFTGSEFPPTDSKIANMEAFALLLDEQDETGRLMKAEVYRELGRFREADSLLERSFSEEIMPAVDFIRELVRQREQNVTELRF
jgi:hypothetical protein